MKKMSKLLALMMCLILSVCCLGVCAMIDYDLLYNSVC